MFADTTLTRSVEENTAADMNVGDAIPEATDADTGDTLTYSMEGADASEFAFDASTRQIRTKSGVAYDHEAKSSYAVTVRVSDGTGADTVAVTIAVTDVDEPPAAPAAPSVSATASSATSLEVRWSAPDNAGRPAIASYDLRYCAGSATECDTDGDFTDGPQDVAGTPAAIMEAAITDLTAGTEYQVQVRATNDEGDGAWSASGTGSTAANSPPVFADATLTRSIAENAAADVNVGDAVPEATDADGDPLTYTMEGADADAFTFDASTRQIRTKTGVTYDHEATKNSYSVTIKAHDGTDDGTGDATVAVTIDVTDVDEPPAAPSAPSVEATAGSATRLEVSWSAPDNAGRPAIESYDLRYCAVSATECDTDGDFTDGPQDVEALKTAIAGLTPGTEYQVQVRATNDEGDGAWSASGTGSTAANSPPVFADATLTRSIAENTPADVNVGDAIPEATDDDGDPLTYTMEGADADAFAFDASARQIRTRTGVAYDHEAKPSYSVTVRVSDGTAAATVAVTIAVTDVNEPPAAPAAPSVQAAARSSTSLEVRWTKPDLNGGPEITDYEVQHREGTSGSWTAHPHAGAGTRTRIANLAQETSYQVRVRALNGEAPSAWSASGTGATVERLDHLARAWLARFSREAAKHVTDAIGERMRGVSGPRVALGGWSVMADGEEEREAERSRLGEAALTDAEERFLRGEDAPLAQAYEVSVPELLLASSFHLASEGATPDVPRWSVWGRGARSGFDAAKDAVSVDGEVVTAMLGLDLEWERWLFGMTLSHSLGDGSFRLGGACRSGCAGEVDNTLTGVHPYARYAGSGGLSAWGVLGYGRGEMTLARPGRSGVDADTSMRMAAFGGRDELLSESRWGGFMLAVRSDALFVSASSVSVGGVMDAGAETRRVRLLLEGSHETRFGAESALTSMLEAGVRHDSGDAEQGAGVEVGGGVHYHRPAIGLTVDVGVRGLLSHAERGYEEWGMSASAGLAPGAGGRGLSLRLGSAWGAAGSGGAQQLWARRSMAGLAREADLPGARIDAEVGYGFGGPRGLVTPYTGVALSQGGEHWRAGARWSLGSALDVSLEATLEESAGEASPESGLFLWSSTRW